MVVGCLVCHTLCKLNKCHSFFLLDQSSSWIKYEWEKFQRKKFSISTFYFCRKLDWCNEFVKYAKGWAANLFIFLFSLKLALWTQVNMYPPKKKLKCYSTFFSTLLITRVFDYRFLNDIWCCCYFFWEFFFFPSEVKRFASISRFSQKVLKGCFQSFNDELML